MRKIFFALVVILVPMLVLSEVEGLCVGTGSIPVHAQEKVPPFEKGGAGGIVAEFPFPASEEALFWGEEEKIISATKYIKRLREAPAIATVITAEQIRNMDARNLLDVLKTVPGIGVSIS